MKHWLYAEFTKLSTLFIIITQWLVHWEDIYDRFSGWFKLSHLIERRHNMNPAAILTGLGAIQKIVPILNAIIADLGPDVATLGADVAADVAAVSKTLNDFYAALEALKTSAVAAAKTPPAAA